MVGLTLYLESDLQQLINSNTLAGFDRPKPYGGYVIQQDYWLADGQKWVARDGKCPSEIADKNPKYISTRFCTVNNETLIPVYTKDS